MADSSYNTYVSPIGRFQAIQGNRLANEAQKLQNEQAPIRAGLMKAQSRGIELGNQDAERLIGQAEEQYRTTDIAARAFQLSRMDDQSMMEGLRQQMPDFAAAAAQNNATPQQVRERLGGIAEYAAMKGYVKLPEAPKQPTSVQEYEYARGQGYKGTFEDFSNAKRKAGTGQRFTQPIEVTGPDGQPMLVQQDPQTGQLMPVQGYKPALGSTETIETGPDGSVRIVRGKGAAGTSGMQRSTAGKIEQKLMVLRETAGNLDQIAADFDPQALTYYGKLSAAISATKEQLGRELSPEESARLQSVVKFRNGLDQAFNAYRQEITGAAASVQELDRLQKTMMNTKMSPTEFQAAFEQFSDQIKRGTALYVQMLENGVSPETAGRAVDEQFGAGKEAKKAQDEEAEIMSRYGL